MDVEDFKDEVAINCSIIFFSGEKFCKPCRAIKPYFFELKEKYPNVHFFYVDIETNEALASYYGIKSVPAFFSMRNGTKISNFTGANKDMLLKSVKHLSDTAGFC